MSETTIEWAKYSWNPVTGCTKISKGCEHCYAATMAGRLQGMGNPRYLNGFEVATHPEALSDPDKWSEPGRVFVCSMGDLFHDDVPDAFIKQVFETMKAVDRHTYLVLTKRAERLAKLAPELGFADNIWAGVTVESMEYVERLDCLRKVPATKRFVSCEPLVGPVLGIDLTDIDWVIVGGESGPGARPMDEEWARYLRDYCESIDVPFFYKQKGAKSGHGTCLLDGREWKQTPAIPGAPRDELLPESLRLMGEQGGTVRMEPAVDPEEMYLG